MSSAGSPDCLFCSSVLEIDVAFVSPNKSSWSGGAGAGDSSGATGDSSGAGAGDTAGDADAGDTQIR